MQFVTLEECREQVQADSYELDSQLVRRADAAEVVVVNFLNRNVYVSQTLLDDAVTAETAGECPIVVVDPIRCAILLIVGELTGNRESPLVLTAAVQALLWPYRRGLGV